MRHGADKGFFSQLASFNDSFSSRLPATLERMGAVAAALDPRAPAAAADELQAMLHTVAGSAATFGYRGLGHHARALEQRLRVLMTFDAVAASDWAMWVAELEAFVEAGRRDPRALN